MKITEELIETAEQNLPMNNGKRFIVMERASGSYIWDTDGNKYIDFLCGIGVNNLGHCPEPIVKAVCEQAQKLMHCSNLYLIPTQIKLAAMLNANSFADRTFFCNSGAEANEAAIKTARRYSKLTFNTDDRFQIITMKNSFHGRTMATLTATGQDKVQKSFEPLLEGFVYAEFNNFESVAGLVTDRTCAIMLEPIQGEGGVIAADPEFLRKLREFCTLNKILLIFDEVQCGMGRSGALFTYEKYQIQPDIMTLAKGLGNGFPIGAMLTKAEIADVLTPGSHGTTFGGNPMGCAAGYATLSYMLNENIPQQAEQQSKYLRSKLMEKLGNLPNFDGLSGMGMMIGVRLTHPGIDVMKSCVKKGLLVNCTANTVIRLLPPLNVSTEDCDIAVEIIAQSVKEAVEQQN